MKENNFNPNDVVSRALLLMKYDSNQTLSENQSKINKRTLKEENDAAGNVATGVGAGAGILGAGALGGAATAAAAGKSAGVGALKAITDFGAFGSALANPVGIVAAGGVLAVTGIFLYSIYRNADNEQKLRDTFKACKLVKSKGYYDELNKNMALNPSEASKAALLYFHSKQGVADVMDLGWGSNKSKMRQANSIMKRGNLADICYMMLKYQGADFADEMAEEFDEFALAEIVDVFDDAVDEYKGGGNKVIPEDSYNINWYKENFGCIFRSKDVWVKEHGVKIDNDGYTYVVIKGLKRTDNKGKPYQKTYRFYGDGARLTTTKNASGDVKDTNATLRCASADKPVAVIQGEETITDMTESRINKYRRNSINEIFDDRDVKVVTGDVLDDKLAGWETGKKVAPWEDWLLKFPCIKKYHPTATPATDNLGYTFFININPKNNKKYRFYSDGEIWSEDGMKSINKTWACPNKGDSVIVEGRRRIMEQIPFDIEGETDVVKPPVVDPNVDPNVGPKKEYRTCLDFPYTEGCYNKKIAEVQSCLNIKPIDAKFGKITLKSLKNNGYGDAITKEVYDKLVDDKGRCKTSSSSGSGDGSGDGSSLVPPTTTTTTTVDPTTSGEG